MPLYIHIFICNLQLTDILYFSFTCKKKLDLALPSPKCVLSLLSTNNHKQIFLVFRVHLFFCVGTRCMNHLRIKAKSIWKLEIRWINIWGCFSFHDIWQCKNPQFSLNNSKENYIKNKEVFSKPSQRCNMELFDKIVHGFQLLTVSS